MPTLSECGAGMDAGAVRDRAAGGADRCKIGGEVKQKRALRIKKS